LDEELTTAREVASKFAYMCDRENLPQFLKKEVLKYLENIDLFIKCWNRTDYESIVLLGRTGVGKSFTLNLIAR
jgi:ABC-type sugar transport system ATPase subunit